MGSGKGHKVFLQRKNTSHSRTLCLSLSHPIAAEELASLVNVVSQAYYFSFVFRRVLRRVTFLSSPFFLSNMSLRLENVRLVYRESLCVLFPLICCCNFANSLLLFLSFSFLTHCKSPLSSCLWTSLPIFEREVGCMCSLAGSIHYIVTFQGIRDLRLQAKYISLF